MVTPSSGPAQEAAQFAAETEVASDLYTLANDYSPDLMRRYNERVVGTYIWSENSWHAAQTSRPGTGGTLWRVIDSIQIDSGFRVTLCDFDSPGLYDIIDGTPVHAPNDKKSLSAEWVTVSRTTKPSALDTRDASTPRLLVTEIQSAVGNQVPGTLCDQYAPEPFIRQPPEPVQSGQK
ncbi:hypothetical protein [Nocardia aurantia]|nr:hypothetical protein [Nocardia aurantia]